MDAGPSRRATMSTSNPMNGDSTSIHRSRSSSPSNTSTVNISSPPLKQLSNLEKAMILNSPVFERANPMSMHTLVSGNGKGKERLEPREAIRQQFHVSETIAGIEGDIG